MLHQFSTVRFVKDLVVLGQIGHEGPLGTFRYIIDKGTRTVWYMDDEGKIVQNVLERDQYDVWAETGALAVYPSAAEQWDEQAKWDKFAERDIPGGTANDAEYDAYWYEWSLYMVISFYLRKTGEDGPNGDKIRRMYQNYQNGLCTFIECIDEIATMNGYPGA